MNPARLALLAAPLLALLLLTQLPAGSSEQGERLAARVDSARAAASAGDHAAAAARYRDAARHHPDVARWLLLSALQQLARAGDLETASAVAEELREDPVLPADSVRTELVRAAFRAGAEDRGLEVAAEIGRPGVPELWTERVAPAWLARGDTVAAAEAYRAAVEAAGAPAQAASALVGLDSTWSALAAAGNSDVRAGRPERGRGFLERALEAAPADERGGLAVRLARTLLAVGDAAALGRHLEKWRARDDLPDADRASLEVLAARHHLARGRRAEAIAAYLRASEASETRESAYASFLVPHMAHGRGEWEDARRGYERTAHQHPDSEYAELSLLRLGLMALFHDDPGAARQHFEAHRSRFPDGSHRWAVLYWEARAREAAGGDDAARERYRQVVREAPFTYYGVRAAGRLGTDPWRELAARAAEEERGTDVEAEQGSPGAEPESDAAPPEESAEDADARLVERLDLLQAADWRERALTEYTAGRFAETRGASELLALATRLNGSGWTLQGIGLGWSAFRAIGRWSGALLRTIYPLAYREDVERVAGGEGLEPALVAALIRQESAFDRAALSPAGAVGLMQLMPATARRVAGRLGRVGFREAELTEPELNLALGARYLSDLLRRFDGELVPALISYNAGPHRWEAWRSMPEFEAGGDMLIERIPYRETRRYVKAILRNRYLYRSLYDLNGPREPATASGSFPDGIRSPDARIH